MQLREKLSKLTTALSEGLIERDTEIKLAVLGLLAQENVLLVGPPGTAKSEISRRLSMVIKDGSYFEYLLTKFTTPEEVFGPLSISKLKNDEYSRNTQGYMPTSNVVFLDEVFKANSAILNSLLTIMNERTYHNGIVKDQTPLLSMIAASNELPIGQNELEALYDRFLLKKFVSHVSEHNLSKLINFKAKPFSIPNELMLTKEEIHSISTLSQDVTIPTDIENTIINIKKEYESQFSENTDEVLSDRKLVKSIKLMKVSAYTNGRNYLDLSDVTLFRHILWCNDQNIQKVNNIINTAI
ncbi:AAA family ATPase [Photobacterium aphoticum]|uniref:AAA family ATPase n=1 Tax=Photobacterium aphoticum TaxID=754436 RepID=UPI00069E3020|nr:AAA family ATPase [Photobacterium aphoticum]PSU57009.1 hypothetical protein C9I90_10920 [Photobacterium aphoticum]GHA49783.1 hypothetical protein GCM10007086_24610 [Photobacterium aphoticum]